MNRQSIHSLVYNLVKQNKSAGIVNELCTALRYCFLSYGGRRFIVALQGHLLWLGPNYDVAL